MYKQHFGLQRDPFEMTPDPNLLFMTASHCEALAGLTYAVLRRKGFVVLTGDAGTGKTTLLMQMLREIPSTPGVAVISNPTLTPGEFLELTLLGFGIRDVPASKAQRLRRLEEVLLEARRENHASVLVIDEAQRLSVELLEEIRLLSNFEHPEGKLLQIVLAGQNEMDEILNRKELRQLKQRIAVRLSIRALKSGEIEQYIRYRWQRAGASQSLPFTAESIAKIAVYSAGIPRVVNAICDNALLLAYGDGSQTVTVAHVTDVARDLALAPSALRSEQRFFPGDTGVEGGAILPKLLPSERSGGGSARDVVVMPTLERYGPPEPVVTSRWRWFRKKPAPTAEPI